MRDEIETKRNKTKQKSKRKETKRNEIEQNEIYIAIMILNIFYSAYFRRKATNVKKKMCVCKRAHLLIWITLLNRILFILVQNNTLDCA